MENNKVVIYYQNVRGLRSKLNTFRLNLLENCYPIVALTETWLTHSIRSSELFPDNYTVLRRDRDVMLTGKSRGGGVLLAVDESINIQRLVELETDGDNIWACLKFTKTFSVILAVVYFPPNSHVSSYKSFFDKLDLFVRRQEHIIVIGDFNQHIVGSGYDLSKGNETCKQLMCYCSLHNLVSKIIY